MYGDGEQATAIEYRQKLRDIRKTPDRIMFRVVEMQNREILINAIYQNINLTLSLLENITQVRNVTEEMLSETLEELEDLRIWISEKVEQQQQTPLFQDPVLVGSEVEAKWKTVEGLVKLILKRPYLKKKAPVKNVTEEEEEFPAAGEDEQPNNQEEANQGAHDTSDSPGSDTPSSSTTNSNTENGDNGNSNDQKNEEHKHDEF